MVTIEAELSKTLNISWADARDLASYARGKLGIIPGDKLAEQTQRQSILDAAIEADKQLPKKRNLPKRREPELHNKETNDNPKQDTLAGTELAKRVQDQTAPASIIIVDRGNVKVANEVATPDGTTKHKEGSSWVACLNCFDIVGPCCELCCLC